MTAILLSFLTSRFVHAQVELATVRGTVTDQQGAIVPQAVVTAREIATNLKRTSTTQQNGQYLLSNLPPDSMRARPAPRGSLRGDDYVDLDMRAGKAFKFKERYTATLFAEVFNLFNTDNFATYNGNILSSAFKTPGTENPKRRAQFGFRFDY